MKNKIWMNNKIVDELAAKVSVFDRSFLYGDAIFETMRSYAGNVFRLGDHIDRLFTSLKTIGVNMPYDKKLVKRSIDKMLVINKLKSAYIRITVSRGQGTIGIGRKDKLMPNAVIVAKNFDGYPEWMHHKGISVKIAESVRQNELSVLSGIKTANFLNYILARIEAQGSGFNDAVMRNTKGYISEAATSNVFLVKKGRLATPSIDSGILPGITRSMVIAIAKKVGIKTEERHIKPNELIFADEVFFTNSLAEVLPVTRVDGVSIGSGMPGEITRLMCIAYQRRVIEETVF